MRIHDASNDRDLGAGSIDEVEEVEGADEVEGGEELDEADEGEVEQTEGADAYRHVRPATAAAAAFAAEGAASALAVAAALAAARAARQPRTPLEAPLLARFAGRSREELLALPGLDERGVDAILAAQAAGEIDRWGDVERVLADAGVASPDVEVAMRAIYRLEAAAHVEARGLTRGSSVLFLASAPKDEGALDLAGERDLVAEADDAVVAIHDPTLGEIEALVETGAFQAVWAAGHGEKGQVLLSDHDGRADRVDAASFAAAVAASPEVRFVLASVCSGAAGEANSVVRTIAAHGPAAAGYAGPVRDADALRMSSIVARALARGVGVRAAVAAAYYVVFPKDGMPSSFPAPAGPARDVRRVTLPDEDDWVPFVQVAAGARDVPAGPPPAPPER